jgi:ArsR family transcriptional regulator
MPSGAELRRSRSKATATATCCAAITAAELNERDAAELAPVFAALSDPVRLRLLSIVATEGEVCSCNLEGPLAKSQPTISHHTRVLSEAGLIEGEKRGRWMWWRIVPGQMQRLRDLLGE